MKKDVLITLRNNWLPCLKKALSLGMMICLLLGAVNAFADDLENQIIKVGVLKNWPPQYITDSETGKPAGFAVDMMELIGAEGDLKFAYLVYESWSDLYAAGKEGDIDLVANVGISENQLANFLFSFPYESVRVQLFTRSTAANIDNLADLKDKNVGVVADSIGIELVDQLDVGFVKSFEQIETAFLALLAGTIDALVYADSPLYRIAAQSGLEDRIKPFGEPLIELKRGIGVVKGKTDLYVVVNAALKRVLKTQDYLAVYGKWYQTPEPYWNATRVAIAMGAVFSLVVVGLVIWRFFTLQRFNTRLQLSINERLKSEKALREIEANFKQFTDNINEVFWIVGPDWQKVNYVSPAYEEVWGRSCQSLYENPLSWLDAVLDEDRIEIEKVIRKKSHQHYSSVWFPEYRICRPDGEIRWILARGFPVRDKQKNIIRVTGIAEDITKQKTAAEELAASEEQVRLLLNHTSEAIYGIGLDGNCTFANPACVMTLGFQSTVDLIGKNIHKLIHHKHADNTPYPEKDCEITKAIAQGEIIHRDDEVFWKVDGSSIPVEYSSAPIWRDDKIVGAVVTFVDISARKKTEQELIAAKDELEARVEERTDEIAKLYRAVEQSPNIVVITDSDGIVQYVNPKFTSTYGYTLEEAVGEKTSILKADNVTRDDFEELWKSIKSGKEWRGELHNLKKNGERVWHLVSISPVKNQAGEITHFIASQENIDAAKKVEFELQKARVTAENASKAKSDFLANMSHELRTPLNAIIGFTQLLEQKSYGGLNEKQLRFFTRIKDAGDHLLQMVNDILDLSKVEAGKIEIEKKPFDMGLLLDRAPLTIQSLANRKNIRIVKAIPDNLGWLEGDEVRIKQVIFNLLSNAFKFTEAGKSIGIEAEAGVHSITITVWDEGIGISETNQKKIFDPFVQVEDDKGLSEGGTGLGLPISKKLVELHGGTLEVTSIIGTGSRFIVTLPGRVDSDVPSEVQSVVIEPVKPEKKDSRGKILVTEDNETNRHLIEASLGIRGYKLEFAKSGEEAVEKASKEHYDLVLMDIRLPGISGSEAMKQIKANSSEALPVVAVTAFAMKGDRQRYLDEGFDGYVSKPIEIEALESAIESCMNR